MTISELIDRLAKVRDEHGDLPVLVDGYEGGYDPACTPVVKDVHDDGKDVSWWGRFVDGDDARGKPVAPAVVIPR